MIGRLWKVAHRGASAELPENTLPAFERAVELGADVIEADVRATKSGDLLILHDETVDRTTNGTGPLRALTTRAARKLDAGDGNAIPTVAEVLAVAKAGGVRANLDVKEPDIVDALVSAVDDAGMADQVTYISFLPEVWEALEAIGAPSPVIPLTGSAAALASVAMGEAGTHSHMAGVGVAAELVTPALVERMRRHGFGVFAWTVDDAGEMRRLLEAGVNGIVTNQIGTLIEIERELRAVRPN